MSDKKDAWQKVECYNCGKKVTYLDRPISTTNGPLCRECRDREPGDGDG